MRYSPLEDLSHVGQVHLDAMLVFVCAERHVTEQARFAEGRNSWMEVSLATRERWRTCFQDREAESR